MKTRRLYQEDVYRRSCEAAVTDIAEDAEGIVLTFDQTVFFPTGGGQSCDRGTAGGLTVIDVFEDGPFVRHRCLAGGGQSCGGHGGSKHGGSGASHGNSGDGEKSGEHRLSIGDKVELAIDWQHRFDNMQRHCGEHILSGKFYELFGGVNRGFHMGEDYMTIDISLEENPAYDKVTWEMAKEAELSANEVIWQNLPVITRRFDSREEAENLPLRKALAFDEDISIVCVGSVENPADCVACCGTHPSTAGQVGMLKIYKVEVNKGMYRVYFEAGQRAFRQYQERLDVLTTLENRLSAGFSDLLPKYEAQQEKTKEVRNELYQLKKWIISREIDDIRASLTPAFVRKYDKLAIGDLLDIGKGLSGSIPTVAFLVHQPTNTVLLFTDKYDAGRLVKENAHIYQGKGGGSQKSARAIFAKAEYVDTFIDLIEKHLR